MTRAGQPPRPPRPLPFNGAVVDALRPSVQIRLEALPLLLMCAPVFPLVHSAAWQEAPAAGAGAAGALLSFALVGAMCLGFLAGWLCNALVCRWLLGWPADRVRALFLHSEVPPRWFEDGVRTRAEAEAQARDAWQQEVGRGPARLVLVRGVVHYGTHLFLATYVVPPVVLDRGTLTAAGALQSLAMCWLAGAVLGGVIWYGSRWCQRPGSHG